jgi:hypothetical protein
MRIGVENVENILDNTRASQAVRGGGKMQAVTANLNGKNVKVDLANFYIKFDLANFDVKFLAEFLSTNFFKYLFLQNCLLNLFERHTGHQQIIF